MHRPGSNRIVLSGLLMMLIPHSPMIEGDFTNISSSREPLDEGLYTFKLIEIIDQVEDDEWKAKNVGTDKTPGLVFVSEVIKGERVGAQNRDYIYTKQKDGKVNKMGLGQIKGYAEAILGKEAANSPTGVNTDLLLNGTFDGYMKVEKYQDKETKEQKSSSKLVRLLPAS